MNDIERQLRAAAGAPPPTEREPVDPEEAIRTAAEPIGKRAKRWTETPESTPAPATPLGRVLNELADRTRHPSGRDMNKLGAYYERDGSITVTGETYG